MGSLMDEMVGTWNHTLSLVLQEKTKILELDNVLTHRDVMTAWKKLALGLGMAGEAGIGNISAVSTGSMNMGSVPTTPHSSSVTFLTPSTITQLQHKRVRDLDVPVCKSTPLPIKLSELSTDEEFYEAYLILEEIQETPDPAATTQ